MSIIFTASDLETLMVKILFNKKNGINKSELFNEIKKYYKTNQKELLMCHFLFSWEKLLTNSNFIRVQELDNHEEIKISLNSSISSESNKNPIPRSRPQTSNSYDRINFTIDIKETIEHMCKNNIIYSKSNVIQEFFKKNFQNHNSVYELLIINREKIGTDNVKDFINLYHESLETDDIIKLIMSKQRVKNDDNQRPICFFGSIYNFVSKSNFVCAIGTLIYNQSWILKYFTWFKRN